MIEALPQILTTAAIFVVVSLLFVWLGVRSTNPRTRRVFIGLALASFFPLVAGLLNHFFAGEPGYGVFTTATPGPPAGSPSVVRMVPFPVNHEGVAHRASWSGGDMDFQILNPDLQPREQGRGSQAVFTPDAPGNWTLRLEVPASADTVDIRVVEQR